MIDTGQFDPPDRLNSIRNTLFEPITTENGLEMIDNYNNQNNNQRLLGPYYINKLRVVSYLKTKLKHL